MKKVEEFIVIMTVLFMMENLKVGSQKEEQFVSVLLDGEFADKIEEGRGDFKYPSGAVYD